MRSVEWSIVEKSIECVSSLTGFYRESEGGSEGGRHRLMVNAFLANRDDRGGGDSHSYDEEDA